jgi:hypothetical protein
MKTPGNLPEIVSREEWLAARLELLAKEKEVTRARDRLNADRRRLPVVRMDKPYTFEGPGGPAALLDLLLGRQESWEEPKGRAEPLGLQVGGPRDAPARRVRYLNGAAASPYLNKARYLSKALLTCGYSRLNGRFRCSGSP